MVRILGGADPVVVQLGAAVFAMLFGVFCVLVILADMFT